MNDNMANKIYGKKLSNNPSGRFEARLHVSRAKMIINTRMNKADIPYVKAPFAPWDRMLLKSMRC